eukprot:1159881-Pelagomonas_calceolata.AAC.10
MGDRPGWLDDLDSCSGARGFIVVWQRPQSQDDQPNSLADCLTHIHLPRHSMLPRVSNTALLLCSKLFRTPPLPPQAQHIAQVA